MDNKPRTNIERLGEEGFTIDPEMPQEYVDVIEELRPDEIGVMIDVTRRLERARVLRGDDQELGYRNFMPPF
jgi:hypothetical protein